MQPTKIALQNFLSYGDAEVDLTGLSEEDEPDQTANRRQTAGGIEGRQRT